MPLYSLPSTCIWSESHDPMLQSESHGSTSGMEHELTIMMSHHLISFIYKYDFTVTVVTNCIKKDACS